MRREPPSRVGLLQGTPDLLILRTVLSGRTHGHAIAKHIQRTSDDLLARAPGSMASPRSVANNGAAAPRIRSLFA